MNERYKETDMQIVRRCVVVLWASLPMVTLANDFLPTGQECHEGSDFIKHAVMSQNNGYSREWLVRRFDDQVFVLSGMDPRKRWFVRSPGATRFLREALVEALVLRRKPEDQASVFLQSCMRHALTPNDL